MLDRDDRVESLLAGYVERRLAGQPPPTPAELCSDCPELLEPLKAGIARYEAIVEQLSGSESLRPLSPGTRLGPYEIVAQIGEGGMGKVYRARDSRLDREVAIKTSSERFSERFEREAHAVAALNHPNVCTLHDVGPNYLVMELIEGATLAERIAEGALPLEEALDIARQIAAALDAAHEKGIVHRDLKPGNVKLASSGVVKVLDFGLAKELDPDFETHDPDHLTQAPTLTPPELTETGVILGTAAYMAPEQAGGQRVDKRADIWAFGVILYEMLTGSQPFAGESLIDTLMAVLQAEPDLEPIPIRARRAVAHCLERDPSFRLRDIGDFEQLLEEPAVEKPASAPAARWLWSAVGIAALVAAALAITVALWLARPPLEPLPDRYPVHLSIDAPGGFEWWGVPTISPDSRYLVFRVRAGNVGEARLWVRPIDSAEGRFLEGTKGATGALFWSPDSERLAFVSQGKLRKIRIEGGEAEPILDVEVTYESGAWSEDGAIVLGGEGGLVRTDERGGAPTRLTEVEAPVRLHAVSGFLPDQRRFLYYTTTPGNRGSIGSVRVGSLDLAPGKQPAEPLLESLGGAAFYVPHAEKRVSRGADGFLVFLQGETLLAQPMRLDPLELLDERLAIAQNLNSWHGFGASSSGGLVYVGVRSIGARIVRVDRQGRELGVLSAPSQRPTGIHLSPDGSQLAVIESSSALPRAWVIDVARNASWRFHSEDPSVSSLVFSPDGRVAFTSGRNGQPGDLYALPLSGVGEPQLLVTSATVKHPDDWSRDGRFLIYDDHVGTHNEDLFVLDLESDREPIPFRNTEADEMLARFSPDGNWIVYESNESGRNEIYVRDFAPDRIPAHGRERTQVSTDGGRTPHWSPHGDEIFYLKPPSTLMAVPIATSPALEVRTPEPLFDFTPAAYLPFVVLPDGAFVLIAAPDPSATGYRLQVILDWQAGLELDGS